VKNLPSNDLYSLRVNFLGTCGIYDYYKYGSIVIVISEPCIELASPIGGVLITTYIHILEVL